VSVIFHIQHYQVLSHILPFNIYFYFSHTENLISYDLFHNTYKSPVALQTTALLSKFMISLQFFLTWN
jgi:hypothetical protein